jgi:hypothetical protein
LNWYKAITPSISPHAHKLPSWLYCNVLMNLHPDLNSFIPLDSSSIPMELA